MGQGQAKIVVEAATVLASPEPAKASDFEKVPLFWTVPLTRSDTFSELPAKLFLDIRKSNPQKFALLIVHVRFASFTLLLALFNPHFLPYIAPNRTC